MTMKKTMLITALVASMAGSAAALMATAVVAQPMVELRFGFEAPGSFWYHAPTDIGGRIEFIGRRIDRMKTDGRIDANEYRIDRAQITNAQATYQTALARDHGQLSQEDELIVWHKIKEVSDRMHWQAAWGY
jgi:hypothetical protein